MYSDRGKDFYVMQAREAAEKADRCCPEGYNGTSRRSQSNDKGFLKNILTDFKDDDLLIIGLMFLIFNEHNDDDFLILLILAILLFT